MSYSPLIYTPGGAALEYCPAGALALNPFEGLCPFSCHKTEHGGYNCYANQMAHQYKRDWPMRVKENLLERLEREAARKQKQAWLSPDLDLLLIDDWGNHYGSEWAHNRAYCIVEALYVREAAVCVTTQLAPAALLAGEKGTVAIASRFADMTDMVITGNVDGRVTPQEAG